MTQKELEAELERLKAERDRKPTREELQEALKKLIEYAKILS